jgi:hypothetical protein
MTHVAVRSPRLATGAALVVGAGLVAAVDPHQDGRFPPCLWHAATGTWCPGCGGLRATYDLLHGHLAAALSENMLVVAVAALLPGLLLARRTAGRTPARRRATRSLITVALTVLALVFALLRNLPVGAALAP